MKITIEIDTAKGEHRSEEAIALLGGSVLLAHLDREGMQRFANGSDLDDLTTEADAKEEARELHDEKTSDKYDPAARIYGEKGEKSRRTKEEMAEDEEIAEAWALRWPSKDVPAKPVGELRATIDAVAPPEEGFSVNDEPDTPTDEDPMDLDEFRGVIVKHAKKLGNKKLTEIMSGYKNPGEVPEEERRDFAEAIEKAAADG